MQHKGRQVHYGLNALAGKYIILDPMVHSSSSMGLPMQRERVFIVLLSREAVKESVAANIPKNLELIRENLSCAQTQAQTQTRTQHPARRQKNKRFQNRSDKHRKVTYKSAH